MKILLVAPSGVMYRSDGGIFPRVLRYAPMTLAMLGALVPEDLEAKIELVDEGVKDLEVGKDADLVGITAITGTATRAYAIADYYRAKGTKVILGGTHPTLLPDEAQEHADSVVTGLAFQTWPQLLRDFKAGELKPRYDPGLVDLSGIPTPRRDLLDRKWHLSIYSTQATFGCPYKCDFCAVVATQSKYRHRPIDEVIAELETLGKHVVFIDPSPTEDKKYIKELWRRMIPLKKQWGGLATVRIADDPELMDLAEKSGCKGLLIGFETLTQESANGINKPFNKVSNYYRVARELHQRGISINGTFLFGTDADDKDSFKRTVDFINEARIELPRFSIYTPFPGTPLFNRLEGEGRILHKDWSLYDAQHVVYKPAKMTPDELFEGLLWAWENTYKMKSILHRAGGSGSFFVPVVSNLGYRYYGYGLREYPDAEMRRIETERNAPFTQGVSK